jgi:hypothetical protein
MLRAIWSGRLWNASRAVSSAAVTTAVAFAKKVAKLGKVKGAKQKIGHIG